MGGTVQTPPFRGVTATGLRKHYVELKANVSKGIVPPGRLSQDGTRLCSTSNLEHHHRYIEQVAANLYSWLEASSSSPLP